MINSGIYIYIYVKHSYLCHSSMRYCVVHSLNLVCTVYVYILCPISPSGLALQAVSI